MKNYTLLGFYLLMTLLCCFTALYVLLEPYLSWTAPGLFLLAMGLGALAVAIGLWRRRRWVRVPVLLLLPFTVVAALFILAGSFLWPEFFSIIVIVAALAALGIEFLTLFHAGSFPAAQKSDRQDLL